MKYFADPQFIGWNTYHLLTLGFISEEIVKVEGWPTLQTLITVRFRGVILLEWSISTCRKIICVKVFSSAKISQKKKQRRICKNSHSSIDKTVVKTWKLVRIFFKTTIISQVFSSIFEFAEQRNWKYKFAQTLKTNFDEVCHVDIRIIEGTLVGKTDVASSISSNDSPQIFIFAIFKISSGRRTNTTWDCSF